MSSLFFMITLEAEMTLLCIGKHNGRAVTVAIFYLCPHFFASEKIHGWIGYAKLSLMCEYLSMVPVMDYGPPPHVVQMYKCKSHLKYVKICQIINAYNVLQ